jgi:hypothetical protein
MTIISSISQLVSTNDTWSSTTVSVSFRMSNGLSGCDLITLSWQKLQNSKIPAFFGIVIDISDSEWKPIDF